jgi:hypothetical protein
MVVRASRPHIISLTGPVRAGRPHHHPGFWLQLGQATAHHHHPGFWLQQGQATCLSFQFSILNFEFPPTRPAAGKIVRNGGAGVSPAHHQFDLTSAGKIPAPQFRFPRVVGRELKTQNSKLKTYSPPGIRNVLTFQRSNVPTFQRFLPPRPYST